METDLDRIFTVVSRPGPHETRVLSALPPSILVGHSLGGLVALDFTLRRPEHVAGLVLLCSMGLGPSASMGSRLYLRAGPELLARARSLVDRRSNRIDAEAPLALDDEAS